MGLRIRIRRNLVRRRRSLEKKEVSSEIVSTLELCHRLRGQLEYILREVCPHLVEFGEEKTHRREILNVRPTGADWL